MVIMSAGILKGNVWVADGDFSITVLILQNVNFYSLILNFNSILLDNKKLSFQFQENLVNSIFPQLM